VYALCELSLGRPRIGPALRAAALCRPGPSRARAVHSLPRRHPSSTARMSARIAARAYTPAPRRSGARFWRLIRSSDKLEGRSPPSPPRPSNTGDWALPDSRADRLEEHPRAWPRARGARMWPPRRACRPTATPRRPWPTPCAPPPPAPRASPPPSGAPSAGGSSRRTSRSSSRESLELRHGLDARPVVPPRQDPRCLNGPKWPDYVDGSGSKILRKIRERLGITGCAEKAPKRQLGPLRIRPRARHRDVEAPPHDPPPSGRRSSKNDARASSYSVTASRRSSAWARIISKSPTWACSRRADLCAVSLSDPIAFDTRTIS
jgi:hypothetical protein